MQLQQAQHKYTDIMLLSDSPNREGNYDTILGSRKNFSQEGKKRRKRGGAIKHCLNGTNETHNKTSKASWIYTEMEEVALL